jgi:hypothetical protein
MNEVARKQCPLRPFPLFIENSEVEVNLVKSLKRRETHPGADETPIFEVQTDGHTSPVTVKSGRSIQDAIKMHVRL